MLQDRAREADRTSALVTWFRALADGSRLRLLALMGNGPLCVEDLAAALSLRQPKVSRHLAYLRRAGLVEGSRHGRRIYYRILVPRDRFGRRLLSELRRRLGGAARERAPRRQRR